MPDPFAITIDDARLPLVLALDIGSTGTRGGIYDATGRPLSGVRAKIAHAFTTDTDGTSEIDADQLVDEVARVIDTVLAKLQDRWRRSRRSALTGDDGDHGVESHQKTTPQATTRTLQTAGAQETAASQEITGPQVHAVGFDVFSASLVGVDTDGQAVTPCTTYADSRPTGDVDELRRELDEAQIQQLTGTRLHTSYLPAKLRYLARTQPEVFARCETFMTIGEYVHARLLGVSAIGTAEAGWTGMLERRTGQWSTDIVRAAGIKTSQLNPVHNPDNTLSSTRTDARWPALAGARWLPVVGDGLTANLGIGAVGASTFGMSAATSGAVRVVAETDIDTLPTGLWCYRIDDHRSLVGGALNDVGRLIQWVEAVVNRAEPEVSDRSGTLPVAWFDTAFTADPTPATPLVLPFLSGERSTGWNGNARLTMTGIGAATTSQDLVRGVFEGVALSYRRVFDQLVEVAGRPRQVMLSGGAVTALPSWVQVLADVLETPVHHVELKRSTMRGAALLALDVIDPDGERAPVPSARVVQPRPEFAEHYRQRMAAFEELYARDVAG
ncbi:gluconokinase [Devriesea agamarum]|uniref:gluconokinase n=1 Tax=Devriesea agamarum TaxID=472569 RepID=UPI00071E5E1B|nr:gluconokinase [Devriesea agamarum]